MADIQYLNYGDQQVEQQALLNTLANQVQSYVSKQPWSQNRKEKFMTAYSDIMNRGLRGASNTSGQWMVDVGGDTIDLNSMNKKDKEMYQEAAYFIQQQMASLASSKTTEEKKKSDLPVFDNATFTKELGNHISNNYFGGRKIDTQTDWNSLDKRGENGLRGRTNRAKTLAEALQSYADSLGEDKYNFEGGPFKDLNDFKTRIGNAVAALNTPDEEDDIAALNQIGLRASDWFNNGSGDPSGKAVDGKELTYQQLNEYNQQQAEAKKQAEQQATQEAAAQRQAAQQNRPVLTRSTLRTGKSPSQLKEKYLDDNGLIQALNNYSMQNFNSLSQEEKEEVYGAMSNFAKQNISDELRNAIYGSIPGGVAPNRFKHIPGVDGYMWDDVTKQVVQIQSREQYEASPQQSLFAGVKTTTDRKEDYYNQTGMTTADWEELAGIGLDIASIVDAEPFSAGTLGVAAAFSRNLAANRQPGKKSIMDHVWQGVDYLTGALGFLPGLGDAALAYKVYNKFGPWLRKAMRVPAFLDIYNSFDNGVKDSAQKLITGKFTDMTVKDWKNLGVLVRGIATTRNLNVQNRASRKAMQERGIETSNRWTDKLGITATKPKTESTSPILRMKVKEGTGVVEKDIPITNELKQELDKELLNKGNDISARNEAIRNNPKVQKAAEEAGIKVKEKVTDAEGKVTEELTDNWKNAEAVYSSSLRNSRIFGERYGILPKSLRSSGGMYGTTKPTEIKRGPDNFEKYLSGKRGFWDRFKYGSNRTLRGMDALNGFGSSKVSNLGGETSSKPSVNRLSKEERAEIRDTFKGKRFGTNDPREDAFKIEGLGDIYFLLGKDGSKTLQIKLNNGKTTKKLKDVVSSRLDNHKLDNLRALKKYWKEDIYKQLPKGQENKIKLELIRKLKEIGALKQGGSIYNITEQQVNNFLKYGYKA